MEEHKNPQLWEQARARVGFKRHCLTYIVVNIFLWLVWIMGGADTSTLWPLWSSLGWGLGLFFNYVAVYMKHSTFSAENEYKKLLDKK